MPDLWNTDRLLKILDPIRITRLDSTMLHTTLTLIRYSYTNCWTFKPRHHSNLNPVLTYQMLDIQTKTVRRKIVEAIYILIESPEMNDCTELSYLYKYLVEV
jgi:hypothetical protein